MYHALFKYWLFKRLNPFKVHLTPTLRSTIKLFFPEQRPPNISYIWSIAPAPIIMENVYLGLGIVSHNNDVVLIQWGFNIKNKQVKKESKTERRYIGNKR